MPLSGGKDSRHLLLELHAARCYPDACITVKHYPPRPNADADIAAEITAALALPHVILDPPADRVEAEWAKNRAIGLCSYEHVQYWPMARYPRLVIFLLQLEQCVRRSAAGRRRHRNLRI